MLPSRIINLWHPDVPGDRDYVVVYWPRYKANLHFATLGEVTCTPAKRSFQRALQREVKRCSRLARKGLLDQGVLMDAISHHRCWCSAQSHHARVDHAPALTMLSALVELLHSDLARAKVALMMSTCSQWAAAGILPSDMVDAAASVHRCGAWKHTDVDSAPSAVLVLRDKRTREAFDVFASHWDDTPAALLAVSGVM